MKLNTKPLQVSMYNPETLRTKLIDLPLVDDFEVKLLDSRSKHLGLSLAYSSPSLGILVLFPWWDHVDSMLASSTFRVPKGTFEDPFTDMDEAWDFLSFEEGGFYYVFAGEPGAYEDYFKVTYQKYLEAWDNLISEVRAQDKPTETG